MKEIKIYHSHSDVCGGGSPWKSGLEVTRATLALANRNISVAGLSDQEVLDLHAKHNSQTEAAKILAPRENNPNVREEHPDATIYLKGPSLEAWENC
ncbi:hypothetical protein A2V56_03005 [Candidatus Woesebacteria bacterium RBG_19FT_COMBO_42_9]|nr:MAG: hypothetical protein A2V56_03005 [Candidatus Woesebacteria bacterium RBG_19FT_COMBO_42_9]OGM67396.1 MAG: hypothetical protein A2985_04625 [Candidatus Woesebacteria bacterium RIFCSPLOWO2_01_FULL_43_11]